MKMSFHYMCLVLSFLCFLPELRVNGCDHTCQHKVSWTPSKVVVKYGDPISAKCTLCDNCSSTVFNLEYNVGNKIKNGSERLWTVDKITEWEPSPMCYYVTTSDTQCCEDLDVIVYKPPQNVSISFNHTGAMNKDDLYTLQCDVLKVAPVENLTVTFYKGDTALVHLKSHNKTTKQVGPVSNTFTYSFNISKEDNGAEFWCEAKLELGPEGPQPPPVVKSGKVTATVHYGPELKGSSDVQNINIKRGETLRLNCSADGNPPPSYTWEVPFENIPHNDSVFTVESVGFGHKGEYRCNISNSMGFAVAKFNVTVALEDIIVIILGTTVGLFLICVVALMVYKSYKHSRMGHYRLKDVFYLKKKTRLNSC